MRVVVVRTNREAADAATRVIAETLTAQPAAALALPTGRTAEAVYAALVARHRNGGLRFASARAFNLDEFLGVPRDDPRSFAAFLNAHLLTQVDLSLDRVRWLDGATTRWRDEAERHDRAIAGVGGLDLAVLGIGVNGHIGFNEPAATLEASTHRVRLASSTRRAYAASFGSTARVPRHALTMGMGTILRARRVLLAATGLGKARIVKRALEGPITTRVPAALLQLHPDAIAVLDRDAASLLRLSE